MYWEGNYCLDYKQFPAFWLRPLHTLKNQFKKLNSFNFTFTLRFA